MQFSMKNFNWLFLIGEQKWRSEPINVDQKNQENNLLRMEIALEFINIS